MPPLHFSFQEFDTEIDAIAKIAENFLSPTSGHVLSNLKDNLEQIRSSKAGRTYTWGISDKFPLMTKMSSGDYEPQSHGELFVHASISSVWDIEPLGNHNPGSYPSRKFALAGKASTRVRLYEGEPEIPGRELAMWKMDIGDDRSPGCHFHVQVLGENEEPPFPHTLPVPRFPSLLMTPMSVLEFVLAELFQDEWKRHVAGSNPFVQRWQPIQKNWIGKLLKWQYNELMRLGGSPWTSLKGAKPEFDLFL
jgi:hypothetical protein